MKIDTITTKSIQRVVCENIKYKSNSSSNNCELCRKKRCIKCRCHIFLIDLADGKRDLR